MAEKKEALHAGHRGRMREKFVKYGRDVFHTHELLEMLLFYAIPYKNTNPLAKNLIARFSTLDGVLSAGREELMSVDGIGPKIADALVGIGRIDFSDSDGLHSPKTFGSYKELGEFFVEYFNNTSSYSIAVMLLNSKMELIGCEKVYDTDYDSAAVKAEPFIDLAMKMNASVAVIAHTHPYGPKFPTPGDIATNTMINSALSRTDVTLLEHYIVSGREFVGFMNHLETEKFLKNEAMQV